MRARALWATVLAAGAAAAPAAAPAAALPVYAHRGGPVVDGRAAYPENTLPAFRAAARAGTALELDVRLTLDRVPIVIHDTTFDRTTTCAGPVAMRDSGSVRKRCRADVRGVAGDSRAPWAPARRTAPVPTLAQVLALARRWEVRAMVEIKGDMDRDALAVVDTIQASGIPRELVIVQSFRTRWLDVARWRWPGVATALLSTNADMEAARARAAGRYAWIAPRWPVDAAFVARAHRQGLKVLPFSVNSRAAVARAVAAGVDALITNDAASARRTLTAAG